MAHVAGQFTAPPPTCPGDTFTFRCTVTGDRNGITIWRVSGSSECLLTHNTAGTTSTCGPGRVFTARIGTGFGPSFSSTLSGTATSTLNGTLVECFGPALSRDAENRVGGSSLQISGPPSVSTLSCVDLSEDVSGAVNVTVSWTLSGGDTADFYLINITTNAPQIQYGGLLNITTASVTQHELTGFMTGYEYNITVHGICGGQEGSESKLLTIRPQVPDAPTNCTIAVIYTQLSRMLLSINSTWYTAPDIIDSCPGLNGDITHYQISFQTVSTVATENVNIAKCTGGRCSHTFEPPSNPPSSYDSVSVAAENVVGVGAAKTCTTQTISTTNNVLSVAVRGVSSLTDTQLQCIFLSGFTGSAHCTVQYGTDPTYMNLPYSAESTGTGTAGDSVSVVLMERLNSSTVYYYTVSAVSGDITVTVLGTFNTPGNDCPLSELQTAGLHLDDIYPQCQQDQDTVTSITIPNGVVNVTCYSGRQFVSVASHVCDEGYQPNATSTVRVCRDNGLWSGTTVVCDSVAAATFGFGTSVAVGIAVVITGIIALIVGFLAGILVYYCISNYRLQSAKPESSFQHQPQTIPSSNLLQQTGPEYAEVHAKKIELKENMAYVHVQRRELRANVPVQH